jgi:serine/threonine-protein kinase PknK
MSLWKKSAAPSANDEEIPGYADLQQVGQGGFGVVYRARQQRLGREVAVKILAVPTLDDSALRKFQQECELTSRLTGHPNVVTVLDIGMTRSGRPYVVTEYFEHGSLKKRLDDDGPMAMSEVLRIGVKIAGALSAAHKAGILHRDVKPQNILLSTYGEPALADFGIARLLDAGEVSTRGEVLTPYHVAPEILEGGPSGPAIDTYALGSTLYQLLAGRSAYQRTTDEGIAPVLRRILIEEPPEIDRADVAPQVKEFIRKAMAKTPGDRFADPVAMAEQIQRLQRELDLPVTELPSDSGTARQPASSSDAAAESIFNASWPTGPKEVSSGPSRHGASDLTPEDTSASATVLKSNRPAPAKAQKKPLLKRRSWQVALGAVLAVAVLGGAGTAMGGILNGSGLMGWVQSDASPSAPPGKPAASGSPQGTAPSNASPANSGPPGALPPGQQPPPGGQQPPPESGESGGSGDEAPSKPKPPPSRPKTNPYSPQQVCGSGYSVQESHTLKGARAYQLYNGSTNCAVTIKTSSIGVRTAITAGIQAEGGSWVTDSGSYEYYAGPAKTPAKGKCVRYRGSHGGSNYVSSFGHCG